MLLCNRCELGLTRLLVRKHLLFSFGVHTVDKQDVSARLDSVECIDDKSLAHSHSSNTVNWHRHRCANMLD